MWSPHPPYCRVTDTEGQTHLVCLPAINRVTLYGTPEAPDVEIWIAFGGTLRLAGEQAARFLDIFRDWGHEVQPR